MWRLSDLPFGYRMLVQAARGWADNGGCPATRWVAVRDALARLGAEDTVAPFHHLMTVIHAGARAPILLGGGGQEAHADEVLLAELVARSVLGEETWGRRLLECLLEPWACRRAQELLREIGYALRDGGMSFSRASFARPEPEAIVH